MLGPRIAALRRSAGLSQAELAQRLQVSPSAVGMYEQGRREPAGDILVAIAQQFGVTTDYLLTGRTGSEPEQQITGAAMQNLITEAESRFLKRDRRPFTRQELTVLFAAMLMES